MSGKFALSKNGVVWLMKSKNFETQKIPQVGKKAY